MSPLSARENPGAPAARVSLRIALAIFLPFAAGYYLSYTYRAVNAVIAPDLVADAGLSAADLGLLTSMYFIAFAVLQLPLGVLLDRFGPRRIEAAFLTVAAAGSLLFAASDDLFGLSLGRAMIGVGVSCCMMAAFKAFVMWFDPRQLPFINGCLLTFGALGAVTATAPAHWLVDVTSWRVLFVGLGLFAAVVSLVVLTVVPDNQEPPAHTTLRTQLKGLRQVFSDSFFWRIAPLAAICQGTSMAVHSLWAGPWLRDVAGLNRGAVAAHLMVIALSMGVGFFTMGLLAQRLARVGIRPLWLAAGGMSAFMVTLAILASDVVDTGLWLLLACLGFLATSGSLSYAVISQHFTRALAGRSNTAHNLLVFLAASLLQWGIGAILGYWENPLTHRYSPEGYQVAFGGIVLLQVTALLWFFRPIGTQRNSHRAPNRRKTQQL